MIRFAIWAAVSSEAQAVAGEKVSLEVQVDKCKEVAASKGWTESAGPYIVRGESRQRWVNLRDAEMEIPELRQAMDDAQAGRYDVLVMYDYNRLRDLLDLVSKTLSHYQVQLFSVTQPVDPQDPRKYSPYSSDVSAIVQVMARFTSTLQNNDLRRKYMEAMPRRVTQRGLPAGGHVPFGYKKGIDARTPPTVDQELANLVIEAKDKFLVGWSTIRLAEWLQTTGHAPKSGKWYPQTVKSILVNPFYAGILRWGVTKARLDPRSGRIHKDRHIPPEQFVIGKGKHPPLWDEFTHHSILVEFRKRGHGYRGRSTHRLTSLLTCGICQRRLWTYYNNLTRPENMVWRCSSREEHVVFTNTEALRLVGLALANDLAKLDPLAVQDPPEGSPIREDLLDLKEKRARIGDAYAAGAFGVEEFLARAGPIDDKIGTLEHRLAELELTERDLQARAHALHYLQEHLQHVPAWLAEGDPLDVNRLLRSVLDEIVVDSPDDLRLVWRQ